MSTSSISWTADATARYERLAAEYSKLRSNANVLKNGVLEERAKSQKLSDSLQNSETQLRKAQAENESLSFRNEQLTKRVLSLQEELDSSKRKDGKKEKPSKRENFSAAMEADLKNKVLLLEEELQNKMNENMNLTEKINELELLHSKEIMEISEKFAAQINRLEGQLEEARHLNVENEKKLAKTAETREIETAVVIPFTLHNQLKNNNDPLLKIDLNAHAPPRPEAYRLCCESGRLCSSAISTFLHLYSERTTLFPYDSSLEQLPQEIQQLSTNLSEASTKAHNMAMFLQDLLEREQFDLEIELISFLNHFSPFCASLNVLKPGFSALLNAETRGTWSTSHLDRLSHQFTDHVQKLTEKFEDLLHELQNRSFSENLASKLHQLANIIKDLKDSYCTRWRVESQLPIATKKLKCVGGALTNCLNQLSLEAGRFGARFEKALLIKAKDEESTTSTGVSPLHKIVEIPGNPFDQPTTSATDAQDDDIEDSGLKVNEEVKEIKASTLPAKSPNLSEETSSSLITLETACEKQRTRITELETEREQLLVEIALLKRKAERAQKEKDEKTTENTSNQMEAANSNDDQNEVTVVKHFYSERLSETFTHLQVERDRAKHLTAECSSLLRRASVAEDERRLLEERMKALNKQKQQVEEELSTIRRGYEEQMGELTAHVAELNTKMGLNGQQQGTDRSHQNGSTNSTPRSSFARKLLFQKEFEMNQEALFFRQLDSLIYGYLQRRNYIKTLECLIGESPHLSSLTAQAIPGKVFVNINDVLHDKTLEQIIENFSQTWRSDVSEGLVELVRRLGEISKQFTDYTLAGPGRYEKNIQRQLYARREPTTITRNASHYEKNQSPYKQSTQLNAVRLTPEYFPPPTTQRFYAQIPPEGHPGGQQVEQQQQQQPFLDRREKTSAVPMVKNMITETLRLAQNFQKQQNDQSMNGTDSFDAIDDQTLELLHQAMPHLEERLFDFDEIDFGDLEPSFEQQTMIANNQPNESFDVPSKDLNIPIDTLPEQETSGSRSNEFHEMTSVRAHQPKLDNNESTIASSSKPVTVLPQKAKRIPPSLSNSTRKRAQPRKQAIDAEQELLAVPAIQVYSSNVAPVPETTISTVQSTPFTQIYGQLAMPKSEEGEGSTERFPKKNGANLNLQTLHEPNVGFSSSPSRFSPINDSFTQSARSGIETTYTSKVALPVSVESPSIGERKSAYDSPTDSEEVSREDGELETSPIKKAPPKRDEEKTPKPKKPSSDLMEDLFGDVSSKEYQRERERSSTKSDPKKDSRVQSNRSNRLENKTTERETRKDDEKRQEKKSRDHRLYDSKDKERLGGGSRMKDEDRGGRIKEKRESKDSDEKQTATTMNREEKRRKDDDEQQFMKRMFEREREQEKRDSERSRRNPEAERRREEERKRREEESRRREEAMSRKQAETLRRSSNTTTSTRQPPQNESRTGQKWADKEKTAGNSDLVRGKALKGEPGVLEKTIKLMDRETSSARNVELGNDSHDDGKHVERSGHLEKSTSSTTSTSTSLANQAEHRERSANQRERNDDNNCSPPRTENRRVSDRHLATSNGAPSQNENYLFKSTIGGYRLGSRFASITSGTRALREADLNMSIQTDDRPSTSDQSQKTIDPLEPRDPRITQTSRLSESSSDAEIPADPRLKILSAKRPLNEPHSPVEISPKHDVKAAFDLPSSQPQKKIKLDLHALIVMLRSCARGIAVIRRFCSANDIHEERYTELLRESGHYHNDASTSTNQGHKVLIVHPHIRWGRHSASKWTDPQLQLEEAIALVGTLPTMKIAGSTIVGTDYHTNRRLIWGTGKLEELRLLKKQFRASALMVNVDMLQPNQQASLFEMFGVPVFDRYNIVLSIFKQFATTLEAKLQIQLAEIPYVKHRLHYMFNSSHSGGLSPLQIHSETFGPRGADKFEVLRLREQMLRRKLKEAKEDEEKTAAKNIADGSLVAVVGYTNAGKTSLVKRLTGSASLQPLDRLFATLDTTRHAARLPSGFLSDLPIHLLAAFEATLGHLKLADVIVHLRDVSHPDWKAQSEEVISTLKKVGVGEDKMANVIHVDNKVDKLRGDFTSDLDSSLQISCKSGEGIDGLIGCIERQVIASTGCRLRRIALKLDSPGIQWLYHEGLVMKEPESSTNDRLLFDVFMTDGEMKRFQKNCNIRKA
ncbi:unnamed protein product, partial [Mesorhabditis belari]|uniref:Protein phosphatase 1 regulatory subunit 21 n=1 Tax=Mesorhabditis belari TaxID=2138241 RepID=A0AAF3JC10_9BILA